MRPATSVASLAIVLVVVGCLEMGPGSLSFEFEPPPLVSLSIEPDSLSLGVGQTAVLKGVALNAEGEKKHSRNTIWTSSNTDILVLSEPSTDQVQDNGKSYTGSEVMVRGVAAGTAFVICHLTTRSGRRLSANAPVIVSPTDRGS